MKHSNLQPSGNASNRFKKVNTTPFNRFRMPPRQNLFLTPLIWLVCWLLTRTGRLKIRREGIKGVKPPFLVLSNHLAFMDFYVTPLALFPYRANYVSELEGFENFGEWIYRQVGCLGTRKYVGDIALVKNIKRVTERGDILVLYPEARYANVGAFSEFPLSVAKLAKSLKVPLVTLNMRGNYLQSPIWNLKKRKGARLEAEIRQLLTPEELAATPVEKIHQKIQEALRYDEYAWQRQQGMEIDFPQRAEGLELALYQCPQCGAEFHMGTQGADIFCTSCNAHWHMDRLGRLESISALSPHVQSFPHIPDWYEWQRGNVHRDIDTGNYRLDAAVRIEALPNAKNFIHLGDGRLVHQPDGFSLTFREYGKAQPKTLHFSSATAFSVHMEYNYRGKGQCIALSTLDNTYFLYPLQVNAGFNATKIMFAAEYLHMLTHKHV